MGAMKIFTKRNAVLGWTAWKVGKAMLKKKTKSGGGKKKVGILAGIGAAIGITTLLKRKRRSGESSSE
jgi:hypothetical protein